MKYTDAVREASMRCTRIHEFAETQLFDSPQPLKFSRV